MSALPRLCWANRQRRVKADWRFVRNSVKSLLPSIVAATGPRRDPEEMALWAGAGEISVVALDDRGMARVHGLFLNDPTPTDVITFRHGEILIGAETAERTARELGGSTESELILYTVHGLLHLRGFEDKTSRGAAVMRRLQEKLMTVLASAV